MSLDREDITERMHDGFAWIVANWAYIVAGVAVLALAVVLA